MRSLQIATNALFGIAARSFDPKLLAESRVDMFERLERLLPRVKTETETTYSLCLGLGCQSL